MMYRQFAEQLMALDHNELYSVLLPLCMNIVEEAPSHTDYATKSDLYTSQDFAHSSYLVWEEETYNDDEVSGSSSQIHTSYVMWEESVPKPVPQYPVQISYHMWEEEPYRGGIWTSSLFAVAYAYLHTMARVRMSDDDLQYASSRVGILTSWTDEKNNFKCISLAKLIEKAHGENYFEQFLPVCEALDD